VTQFQNKFKCNRCQWSNAAQGWRGRQTPLECSIYRPQLLNTSLELHISHKYLISKWRLNSEWPHLVGLLRIFRSIKEEFLPTHSSKTRSRRVQNNVVKNLFCSVREAPHAYNQSFIPRLRFATMHVASSAGGISCAEKSNDPEFHLLGCGMKCQVTQGLSPRRRHWKTL